MAKKNKSGEAFVIGVDSGTSSTRAILFDETGHALAEGRQAYDVLRPQPGWVEQKAEWWWEALVGAIRNLLTESPVKAEQIQNLIEDKRNTDAITEIHELRQTIRGAYAAVREAIDGLGLGVENPSQISERLA